MTPFPIVEWFAILTEAAGRITMLLSAVQERAVESQGWFDQPALEHPAFSRFTSGDPRFPASVLYPAGGGPFYDANRPGDLAAEFFDCFNLVCQDAGFDLLSVDLARYVKQDMEQRNRSMASANRYHRAPTFDVSRKISVEKNVSVGTADIPAVRLQWDGRGEAYCFAGYPHRSSLWSIRRNFDEIGDDDFATVVESFGWLKPEFFNALPARFRFA